MKRLGMRVRAAAWVLLAMATAGASGAACGGGFESGGGAAGEEGSATAAGTVSGAGAGPVVVATCTTGMVADLAREVGGSRVRVERLMGEGVDPHLYKPSIRDVGKLNRADGLFYNGLRLEGKMGGVFERLERRKPTRAVTSGVAPERLLDLEEGHPDPHLWFDVAAWSAGVDVVRDLLIELDPEGASEYAANAARYRRQLEDLDRECREAIATIPESRRVLVTAHDAFHYFGRAYGLEVRAIQGVSTESEAGVRSINELVDFLVSRKIGAVFVESTIPDRNVRALVEGCRARGHAVRIGGELYSDAMGRDGTPEGTYVGMVRHNVRAIVEALR